jgi:hypothetical protein
LSNISWSNWSSTSLLPASASLRVLNSGGLSGRPVGFCEAGPKLLPNGLVQNPWLVQLIGDGEVRVAV